MTAPAAGRSGTAAPFCLSLAAATDALRAATAAGDLEGMQAQEAALRTLAGAMPVPGLGGMARGQILAVLVAARDAVTEAQAALEAARTRPMAEDRRTRQRRLAYSDGGPRA